MDNVKLVQIKLSAAHTHMGAKFKKGQVISVNEPTADWLVKHGVGVVNSDGFAAPDKTVVPAADLNRA